MKIIVNLALTIFGTVLLLFAVINYEPPAVFAYAFGILTGLCWAGIVGLIWIRQDIQADEDENFSRRK